MQHVVFTINSVDFMKEYTSQVTLEVTKSGPCLALSTTCWNKTVSKDKGKQTVVSYFTSKSWGRPLERACQEGHVWTGLLKSGLFRYGQIYGVTAIASFQISFTLFLFLSDYGGSIFI